MITANSHERGAVTPSLIAIIGLSVFTVAFAGLSIWAFVNYMDQKNNVDSKVASAVAEAEKTLGDDLEAKFIEREKEPLKSFTGPSDYGTLGLKYPKTWSTYVSNDGTKGTGYEAFFNPGAVPSVTSASSRYALHVAIVNDTYEDVLADYENLVQKGDLRTSAVKANGKNGTRLDGNFTKDIRGAAVVFKIRDKTAIIQTDADTFKADFEALIPTITFED
jgi:hypothetical protein